MICRPQRRCLRHKKKWGRIGKPSLVKPAQEASRLKVTPLRMDRNLTTRGPQVLVLGSILSTVFLPTAIFSVIGLPRHETLTIPQKRPAAFRRYVHVMEDKQQQPHDGFPLRASLTTESGSASAIYLCPFFEPPKSCKRCARRSLNILVLRKWLHFNPRLLQTFAWNPKKTCVYRIFSRCTNYCLSSVAPYRQTPLEEAIGGPKTTIRVPHRARGPMTRTRPKEELQSDVHPR